MTQAKRPTILLADDHSMVASGLAKLLEDEFDLVAMVEDGRAALTTALEKRPDVALLDVVMPLMSGIEAAQRIHAELPFCKLVFVSMHSDRAFIEQAFCAGASAYVLKRCAPSELALAIHRVLDNQLYITPLIPVTPEDIRRAAEPGRPALSPRQREVLQLVAQGHSAKQVGAILKISPKTVEFHKSLIMKRLNLHSMADMIRYALQERSIGNRSVKLPA